MYQMVLFSATSVLLSELRKLQRPSISLCFSLQFVTSPRLFSETFLGPFTQRQEGTRTLGPSSPRNEGQARGNRTLLTFLVTAGSR